MTKDRWMEPLVTVAREEEAPLDPRLESLIDGTISEDDRRALEADAARDPALREMIEAFTPLDSAAKDRIAAKVLSVKPAAKVISLVSRRTLIFSGLAAAAAVAFAVLLSPRQADLLPSYALEVTGGDQAVRAHEAPNDLIIGPATKIEAVLRPEKPIGPDTAIEARLYLVEAGRARATNVAAQISKDGAARWVARGAELEVKDGDGWLVFVVAATGRMDEAQAIVSAQPGVSFAGDGFRILSRKAFFRTTGE